MQDLILLFPSLFRTKFLQLRQFSLAIYAKARIHCENFLSDHFIKYSFRDISLNMKYFHEIL